MHGCGAYEWQIEVRNGWLGNLKDCTSICTHIYIGMVFNVYTHLQSSCGAQPRRVCNTQR